MYFYGTGRRKTASARVFLKIGNGKFIINNNTLKKYFHNINLYYLMIQPLELTNNVNTFNIKITVNGGGVKSQAEAIRHGISRALVAYNNNLRYKLRLNGYLKRDSREVERKKIGFKKARKSPQFSKR
ncbi:30S ribosomal protein S9 [Candidatus Portiera aleyrodidarum]|nr:30S ribosomal protein S9 [Candidatus Portiera aleyrodidarum]AFQ24208.1 ribosomal protein S9 [Candidatus Portiera aleyrodidarum BT-B-HRs]AFS18964.1 30S ribosomal protein S9 [Candidatus Portiera aleyrodidarum BT-QVLC]AFT80620.1 SSU ribosomal protein S9p (S16e) [Candidatus Portiera aleyrodidarum BT-QVLC]AFT80897.1 SSU ribosomal protein S9p (S16e) [Candidatus Portiera aleyrodidarum BT-B-HRs]ASX27236.1 30S ribosomal protein S9 [Candidatus Portiera aleyrodidarum MED (Bemisia tabaci)]